MVANRLPVAWDGEAWTTSPGGLVRALGPVLQKTEGSWVGWAGIADWAPEPFVHDGIEQRPVQLSESEIEDFYFGFCNGTLWPLYHDAVVAPEFHRHTWRAYQDINQRYTAATAEAMQPDDIAWIQDYQLQLVPAMLREQQPDATIGFYLHIPWPPLELFARLPWRRQIVEGLLGADVIAFQTRRSAENFARAARRYTDAEPVGKRDLRWDGRIVHLQPAPIAIDPTEFAEKAKSEAVQARADQLRQELGNPDTIILGVDRLDYTKGIDLRLKSIAGLLDDEADDRRYAFVQVAVPSREQLPAYQTLRADVEQLVGRINGDYSQAGFTPVSYFYRTVPFDDLVALYVLADVMLVTPLRDGMNLVAKEYVACRVKDDGVLILSEFAGAAEQMRSAVLVNPHDVDAVTSALRHAADMPQAEMAQRMKKLKQLVKKNDVFEWADQCLTRLADQ